MCWYIVWNQWPYLIPFIWHIEQNEEICCPPGRKKYSLPSGVKCVVFGNSTGKRVKVVINGVKKGGVDVSLTLIFCFRGVTQEWISSVFEVFTLFLMEVLSLCWSWWDIIVGVKLVVYCVWFAEDNNTGSLSVGIDIFDQLYL